MINKLVKLADCFDRYGASDIANNIDKILVCLADVRGTIGLKQFLKLNPNMVRVLNDLLEFNLDVETENGENFVKAIPKIRETLLHEVGGINLGNISNFPQLKKYIGKPLLPGSEVMQGGSIPSEVSEEAIEKIEETPTEPGGATSLHQPLEYTKNPQYEPGTRRKEYVQSPWFRQQQREKDLEWGRWKKQWKQDTEKRMDELFPTSANNAKLLATLIKMADKFDQEGELELAAEIDKTLESLAGHKAPLKNLEPEVKKHLIFFINKADDGVKKANRSLSELFRRLRYFDIVETVKDMGLDKAIKEMEKLQICLDEALKRFYELSHGKRPNKEDLKNILEENEEDDEIEDNALDFFAKQDAKKKEEDEAKIALENFWADID